jgi:dihydroxyacetone kinase-like protein
MSDNAARRLIVAFERISDAIEAAQDHLSELDGAIGDADHGITMTLGFHRVRAELGRPDRDLPTPAAVMRTAAAAFLDATGASTGPLYASGLYRAAEALEGAERLDGAAVAAMLAAMAAGIGERGKGQRGDKTMLDAWIPAAEAAADAAGRGLAGRPFWAEVIAAADQGALATRSMVAARGRAARVGQRALGHIDPGAASTVIILKAMAEALAGDEPPPR